MSYPRLILSAACLALLLAVSFLAASGDKAPMSTPSDTDSSGLFARLDQLGAVSSLNPPQVEKIIGMRLTAASPAASAPAPRVYTGSAAQGPFSSAELRIPTDPAASAEAGLLILKLSPETPVTAEQVLKRYGDASSIEPPHPGSPPDTPVYYRFDRAVAKGVLSFGIRDGRVVRVVLDRYPQ